MVIHVYLHTNGKFTKSVTNTFIAALAATDLVTSICLIPVPTLSRIPENVAGHIYCKLIYSHFVMWVSIVASVFSLTTLTIERYVAIISSPNTIQEIIYRKNDPIDHCYDMDFFICLQYMDTLL